MKRIILILWLVASSSLGAQITFRSLEEVFDFADRHAIGIRTAELSEQISMAEKKEAGSYLLPSASASLDYIDNISLQPSLVPARFLNPQAAEDELAELIFGTKFQYSAGIQVQWDALNFQKMFASRAAAMKLEESRAATDLNRFNAYNSLASTYYSILLSQEAVGIYEENRRISEAIFRSAEEKYRKGIYSEQQRNLAEIRKLQTERNLHTTKSQLKQFYLQLKGQLNTEQLISISDRPDKFVPDPLGLRYVHPMVLSEEAKLERMETLLRQQQSLRMPSLSLVYQNNRTWATDSFNDFENAFVLPNQVFGAKLSLSGLLSPATGHKIKQYRWRLRLQEEQVENARLIAAQEDELLDVQLEQATAELQRNREILALQEANDRHSENQYQLGLLSLDDRLDTYDELLVAQDRYLQSLASYTLATYKIYIRQIDFRTQKNRHENVP